MTTSRCARSYCDFSAEVIPSGDHRNYITGYACLVSFFFFKKKINNLTIESQVIEVAPTHCVVELSKSLGKLDEFQKVRIEISHLGNHCLRQFEVMLTLDHSPRRQFCQRLLSLLAENPGVQTQTNVFGLLRTNTNVVEDFRW